MGTGPTTSGSPTASPGDPILSIRGVKKRFGKVMALTGLDLDVGVEAGGLGGVFGLVGPNGAGKTTLFSVLCGFLHADEGEVRVAGHLVNTASPPPSGMVSLLPQDAKMMPLQPVGRQLIYYGQLTGLSREAASQDARRVLESVGLLDVWGRKPDTLSHGMFKRVGIAQAFLGDPRLVILDEPTAGLDPHAARAVKALIRTLGRDRVVMVSSHNLSEVEDLCRSVAILHQGRVVRHETLETLVGAAAQLVFRLTRPPDDVSLQPLRDVPWTTEVVWDPSEERLKIAFDAKAKPPQQAAAELAARLVELRLDFIELQVGQTLEERFLDETRAPG